MFLCANKRDLMKIISHSGSRLCKQRRSLSASLSHMAWRSRQLPCKSSRKLTWGTVLWIGEGAINDSSYWAENFIILHHSTSWFNSKQTTQFVLSVNRCSCGTKRASALLIRHISFPQCLQLITISLLCAHCRTPNYIWCLYLFGIYRLINAHIGWNYIVHFA